MKIAITLNNQLQIAHVNTELFKGTAEEYIVRYVKECDSWALINESDMPSDRTFRDAWILKGKQIDVNIDAVKEIWKDKFRQARKPILERLDVEYIRADEQGNTALKQQIAAKKQTLRDITNIPLPDNLEGIKNTWPDCLK